MKDKNNSSAEDIQERYVLYCHQDTRESILHLIEKLKDGVDVEAFKETNSGLIAMMVVAKKKRGRPQNKNIDIKELHDKRAAGVSVTKLASDYGCTKQNIYYMLKKTEVM